MRVALLFTDGVGIGPRDPSTNPLARESLLLSQFVDGSGTPLEGGLRYDVDTTFGVQGRPQSASNQAAIFTGLPAPRLVGRHVLGFPTPALRALIAEHSIARRAKAAGRSVAFANAFPSAWLDAVGLPHAGADATGLEIPTRVRRKLRAPSTALALAAAGLAFNTFRELHAGRALTHDVEGATSGRRGFDFPRRTSPEAAAIFWGLDAELTVFEHFLADEAGHAQDAGAALSALTSFDRFARAVIAQRPPDALVLVVSDHGNVEDLSTRNHTRNAVAVLAFGTPASRLRPLRDLADVGGAVLDTLEVG